MSETTLPAQPSSGSRPNLRTGIKGVDLSAPQRVPDAHLLDDGVKSGSFLLEERLTSRDVGAPPGDAWLAGTSVLRKT